MNVNPETLGKIMSSLESIEKRMEPIEKFIAGMKIDSQFYLKANPDIAPGVGTKIKYGANGLVLGSAPLEANDIPELPLDKIKSLSSMLQELITNDDLTRAVKAVTDQLKPGAIAHTGIKVNIDQHGNIVSVGDLLPEDIPTLDPSKISQLKEFMDDVREKLADEYQEVVEPDPTPIMSSGFFTKVYVDQYGNILHGDQMTIEDLPEALITRIDTMADNLGNVMSTISSPAMIELLNKVPMEEDADTSEIPGTYLKLIVHPDGTKEYISKLDKKDLPQLSVDDIYGLRQNLLNTASRSEFTEAMNTLSVISENMTQISSILAMRDEVNTMIKQMESLVGTVQTLKSQVSQITALSNQVSSISSTVSELGRSIEEVKGDVEHILSSSEN